MNKIVIMFLLGFSSNSFAQTNTHVLRAPLKCYSYRYNDPSGARSRSNLSATPIMRIVKGNFSSPVHKNFKVLVQALDSNGNVTATDKARINMILSPVNSSHGEIDRTLNITVEGQYGNVIHKYLTLSERPALDKNNKIYFYWYTSSPLEISCFEPNDLPKN